MPACSSSASLFRPSPKGEPPADFDEAAWQTEWDVADTDGDSKLSREEAAANPDMTDEVFAQIDADGDGFISPEEDRAALFKSTQ